MRISGIAVTALALFNAATSSLVDAARGGSRGGGSVRKKEIDDDSSFAPDKEAEKQRLLQEARRSLSKKGDNFEFDTFFEIIEAIFDLVVDGPPKCKSNKTKKSKKESDDEMPSMCFDFYDLIGALLEAFNSNYCDGPGDTISALFEILVTCGFDALENECPESPFDVTKFDDGSYDETLPTIPPGIPMTDPTLNRYAWGAGYNEECEAGVVIHSGGTPALIGALGGDAQLAFPTITLRDADSTIIYEGYFTTPQAGMRSALLVGCSGNTYTVVSTNFNPLGATFFVFALNTDDYTGTPLMVDQGDEALVGEPVGASSVRKMIQLPDPDECTIVYAPLFDVIGAGGDSDVPILKKYNFCTDTVSGDIEILDKDDPFEDHSVWDFDCNSEICWASLVSTKEDESRLSGFDIMPTLVYFDYADLLAANPGTGETIQVEGKEEKVDFDDNAAVLQVLSLEDEKVLACTMSGFVYQALGGIGGDGGFGGGIRDRKLQLLGEDNFLDALELGVEQECAVCNAGKGKSGSKDDSCSETETTRDRRKAQERTKARRGSRTKRGGTPQRALKKDGDCVDVDFPGQSKANAYIWSITKCGGYAFAGSLDMSNIAGSLLLSFAIDAICGFTGGGETCEDDIEDFLDEAVPSLREWLKALLASVLYNDIIHPCDFGFDLWYTTCDDLECSDEPSFEAVTFNGFRGLPYERRATETPSTENPSDGTSTIPPSTFNPIWDEFLLFNFSPDDEVESGIRNMVCHDDRYLVIGSAVYQDVSSNTFVLDTDSIDED